MEDVIQPVNYQRYADGSQIAWGHPVADDPYRAICIRSYMKVVMDTQNQQNIAAPGRISRIANTVRQDLNPKANALVFLRDFLPGLIVSFISNITASGNALYAIQRTIEQHAQGASSLNPGDYARTYNTVTESLKFIMIYLKSNTGLQQEAQDFDEVLEAAAEGVFNKELDVHMAEKMSIKVKNAIHFVESLERYKSQIINYIIGKNEDQIIANAQNMVQNAQDIPNKPMGIWSKIVNWVKNKMGRNKAYTVKIVPGELNQFITNLGLVYHIAHMSTVLIEQIAKTSIMNRSVPNPQIIDPEYLDHIVDQIEDTVDYLKPDTVNAIDYAALNAKMLNLNGYITVLLNTLADKGIDPAFKITQLRSIFLLVVNNLRDLASYCLTMDPLIAVMAI